MDFVISPREQRALLVVAEELHFGRAAERLGMAQPQLSLLVQRVERQASLSIFSRRPRVRLTPAGVILIDGIHRSLLQLNATLADAQAVAVGKSGAVRLGFSDAAMMSRFPALLRQFRSDHPLVDLKLFEGHSQTLAERLQRGELDLIVTRQPARADEVTSIILFEDPFVLAVPEGHWAASEKSVKLADLNGDKFVLFNRSTAPEYFDTVVSGCRSAGLELSIGQAVDTRTATLALVSAGFGVTLSTAASKTYGFKGVTFCQIEDKIPSTGFWLSFYAENLPPAARALSSTLQSAHKNGP